MVSAARTIQYGYAQTGWKDLMTSYNGQSITYDEIGNPLTYRDGMTMTWTGRQLTTLTQNGKQNTYKYDVDGLRLEKTAGGVTTQYQYVNGQLLGEKRSDGVILRYTYDALGALSGIQYKNAAGVTTNYIVRCTLSGDVDQIYNTKGNLLARYIYDTWGSTLSVTDASGKAITDANHIANINPIRYRGYYYDAETGLYYVNSRYYDSEINRFINADDIDQLGADDSPLSYNLFAYCMNNPVNRFDVNGNWSLPNWAKITIGVAAIAVGTIATVATGGAAVPVLVASLKIAATSAAIGAISGAGVSAVSHRMTTGSWKGAGKAAVTGAINGACDGFMWGGITAGATFTTVAAKGIRIREIGKLKPSNKSGNGYSGVKYQAPKANGRYTTRSIELHSPHKSGPHNVWHWQRNTWNPYNNTITGNAKHWTIWGRPL